MSFLVDHIACGAVSHGRSINAPRSAVKCPKHPQNPQNRQLSAPKRIKSARNTPNFQTKTHKICQILANFRSVLRPRTTPHRLKYGTIRRLRIVSSSHRKHEFKASGSLSLDDRRVSCCGMRWSRTRRPETGDRNGRLENRHSFENNFGPSYRKMPARPAFMRVTANNEICLTYISVGPRLRGKQTRTTD
jgi:hypothetical protein